MTICVIQCDTVSANHRFPARYITKRKEKAMYHYMSKPVHIKCISSNGHDKIVELWNRKFDEHHTEPDFTASPIPRKSDVDSIGFNYIMKHSIYMNEMFTRYGIDRTELDKRQVDAYNYYQKNIAPKPAEQDEPKTQTKVRLKPKPKTKNNEREK